eukprot:scaffold76056_cov27-Tisochrysis_lutea.AAC.3
MVAPHRDRIARPPSAWRIPARPSISHAYIAVYRRASSLFPRAMPPVLSFSMGSLGFLTPFNFREHPNQLRQLIEGGCHLTPRMRLSCRIVRAHRRRGSSVLGICHEQYREGDDPAKASGCARQSASSASLMGDAGGDDGRCACDPEWLALNEVVIDRGNAPFLGMLDIYVDDQLITTAQVSPVA